MKLLAVDTSSDACSVALMLDDSSMLYAHEVCPRAHAARLLPMIDGLLVEAGLVTGDLDGFVLGIGPGSFTGVRLGTAAVQGLAWATDRPVVCISSLAAVAQGVFRRAQMQDSTPPWVSVAMDARMGEVYHGVYQSSETPTIVTTGPEHALTTVAPSVRVVLADTVCRPEAVVPVIDRARLDRLKVANGAWLAAGSGWSVYPEQLAAALGARPQRCEATALPDARDLLPLGHQAWLAGLALPAIEVEPKYLRDQVARPRAKPRCT